MTCSICLGVIGASEKFSNTCEEGGGYSHGYIICYEKHLQEKKKLENIDLAQKTSASTHGSPIEG